MKPLNLFLLLLFVLLLSCKKESAPQLLLGKWKRTIIIDDLGSYGFFRMNAIQIANNIELEITKKQLIFKSNKGTQRFKIKRSKSKTIQFHLYNGDEHTASYSRAEKAYLKSSATRYDLQLSGEKGHTYCFSYVVDAQNPTIIYGDYWIKGQTFFSVDKPNVPYAEFSYCPQDAQCTTSNYPVERIAEYEKID